MEKIKKVKEKRTNYFCHKCDKSLMKLIDDAVALYEVDANKFECALCKTAEKKEKTSIKKQGALHPRDVFKLLNDHIAGQEDLKKTLSMAISNHLNRAYRQIDSDKIKNNVIICGPSGTGKTEAIRVISKHLEIPVLFVDITEFSAPGYQGRNVSEIIDDYFRICNEDTSRAYQGIIFIDEIDKKSCRSVNNGDISTSMVQDSLLKMVEGHKYPYHYKDEKGVPRTKMIDTGKILFISAGAFDGMKLQSQYRGVGINSTQISGESKVNRDEIREAINKYGIKAELLRRFPNITTTVRLSQEDIIKILSSTEAPVISELIESLKLMGVSAYVDENFTKKVAEMALKSLTPVAYINNLFLDIQKEFAFCDVSNKKVNLNSILEQLEMK